jgi:HEAT repeat protein
VRSDGIEVLASTLLSDGCDGMVAMSAVEALDLIGGDEAAERVAAALASAEPEVVQAAVNCIGRHGDENTLAELIPLVQHSSWAVRGEAVQVLSERRVSKALPAILRRSEVEQDSFVRESIVDALRALEE